MLVVAVAVAVELAVELVVELAMALDVVGMVAVTRIVVGVVTKTLQCHCFDDIQDSFDAVFHFHSLHLWLESIEAVVLRVTRRVNHFSARNDFDLQSPLVLQQLHHRFSFCWLDSVQQLYHRFSFFWLDSVDAIGDACRNDCCRWNHFHKA